MSHTTLTEMVEAAAFEFEKSCTAEAITAYIKAGYTDPVATIDAALIAARDSNKEDVDMELARLVRIINDVNTLIVAPAAEPQAEVTEQAPAAQPQPQIEPVTETTQQLSKSQRIEQGGDSNKIASIFFRLYESEAKNPPKPLIIGKNLPIYSDDRLIILGSMPAIGKSALAGATTAIELVEQGAHVILCNYEMRHQGSLQRIISCASYREEEMDRIETSAIIRRTADVGLLQGIWNKYISQKPGTITLARPDSPDELNIIVAAARDENPDSKIVIIYDYLQRMPWFPAISEQRLRTKETLRSIQDIANKVQAHSIVIASVNRGGYGKADMSAYKEAGEIESDADIAIVLTLGKINTAGEAENIEIMDEIIAERRQPEVTVLVNIVKQRNGQEGQYALKFIKRFQAFENGPIVSGAFVSREEREQRSKEEAEERELIKRRDQAEKAKIQAEEAAFRARRMAEEEAEAKAFKQQPLPVETAINKSTNSASLAAAFGAEVCDDISRI